MPGSWRRRCTTADRMPGAPPREPSVALRRWVPPAIRRIFQRSAHDRRKRTQARSKCTVPSPPRPALAERQLVGPQVSGCADRAVQEV
eukprot:4271721-Prymnesium_polylepis.1